MCGKGVATEAVNDTTTERVDYPRGEETGLQNDLIDYLLLVRWSWSYTSPIKA